MDYSIDIVISEKDLLRTGINEIKFYWSGKEYLHTPRRFETEDSLLLIGFDIEEVYTVKNIDIDIPIVLTSSAVYDLNHIACCCPAYRRPNELSSHKLMKFLKRVSELERFNIYLQGNDELIDYNIKYTGSPDICEIIYDTLISEKSVMIYK